MDLRTAIDAKLNSKQDSLLVDAVKTRRMRNCTQALSIVRTVR